SISDHCAVTRCRLTGALLSSSITNTLNVALSIEAVAGTDDRSNATRLSWPPPSLRCLRWPKLCSRWFFAMNVSAEATSVVHDDTACRDSETRSFPPEHAAASTQTASG